MPMTCIYSLVAERGRDELPAFREGAVINWY